MTANTREDNCPHCGIYLNYEVNGVTYGRATLVEIRGVYDGGLFFADISGPRHPEGCGRAWHRWAEGSRLYMLATPYIDEWNQNVRKRELSERIEGNPV